MELIYIIGLAINGYIFWVLLQITLAAWGSKKPKEQWVIIANHPVMKSLKIKWLGLILSLALLVQLLSLILLISLSLYTGEPIQLNNE